jgi:hypothetical protein
MTPKNNKAAIAKQPAEKRKALSSTYLSSASIQLELEGPLFLLNLDKY